MIPKSNADDKLALLRKHLGKKIRDTRRSMHLPLKVLAVASHLEVSYISKIENGEANVPIPTLVAVAMTLQINLSELCDEIREGPAARAKSLLRSRKVDVSRMPKRTPKSFQ